MRRCTTCGLYYSAPAPKMGPRERLAAVNTEIKTLEATLDKALTLRAKLEAKLSDEAGVTRQGNRRPR